MKKTFLFFISFLILFSCKNSISKTEISEGDVLLAKVNNEVLLLSQIPSFLLKNKSETDSLAYLKNYVSNWIKDETFIQKAASNLTDFTEIDNKTKQFRKDLIKSSYQSKINESLDLKLTDADIEAYYEQHKEYFIFKEDFYELKYILLPKSTSGIQQIRKNISENKPSAFVSSYCANNTEKCHLEEGILKKESYLINTLKLKKNALIVSSRFKYFYPSENTILIYKIISKKAKGEIAPLKLVENEISILALENKKQEYLQDLEDKTYQKAKNDKIFENYID